MSGGINDTARCSAGTAAAPRGRALQAPGENEPAQSDVMSLLRGTFAPLKPVWILFPAPLIHLGCGATGGSRLPSIS